MEEFQGETKKKQSIIIFSKNLEAELKLFESRASRSGVKYFFSKKQSEVV